MTFYSFELGFVKSSFLAFRLFSINYPNCNKTKFQCSNFLNTICIFLFKGGPSKKITLMGGGGHAKENHKLGGHTIFKLHSSKSHQPPYPIKMNGPSTASRLLQAFSHWGRSKKWETDERDQRQAGSAASRIQERKGEGRRACKHYFKNLIPPT